MTPRPVLDLPRTGLRPAVGDVALAALFAAAVVLETHAGPAGDGLGTSWWLGLVSVLPVVFRRRFPGGSLGAAALLILGPSLVREPFHPWFYGNEVTLYVLLYSYARRSSSRAARWGWLAGPVVFLVQGVGSPQDWDVSDLAFDGLVFGIAWLAGRTVRRFDEQSRALSETLVEIEHEQRAREASAVAAERTRIASEMHDVVAHAVSLMVVQVGATRIRLEKDGRRRSGLDEIEEAGRQALDELRRMLGVLREPSEAVTARLPGVGALSDLVAWHAAHGLRIELEVGPLGDLPDATALAVYRIVQDAFDQADLRGADDIVSAVVRRDGDDILIDVGGPVGAGHGAADHAPRLFRERIGLYRGSLGRRHRERWEVHVLLSLDEHPVRAP